MEVLLLGGHRDRLRLPSRRALPGEERHERRLAVQAVAGRLGLAEPGDVHGLLPDEGPVGLPPPDPAPRRALGRLGWPAPSLGVEEYLAHLREALPEVRNLLLGPRPAAPGEGPLRLLSEELIEDRPGKLLSSREALRPPDASEEGAIRGRGARQTADPARAAARTGSYALPRAAPRPPDCRLQSPLQSAGLV